MKDLKWSQMRREYERGATFVQLAQQHGTSASTISRRARLEGWGRRGCGTGAVRSGCLEQVTEQLAELASRTLERQEEPMSIKEMRELAALVRELSALRAAERERQEGASVPAVRVKLEGDVEKWST